MTNEKVCFSRKLLVVLNYTSTEALARDLHKISLLIFVLVSLCLALLLTPVKRIAHFSRSISSSIAPFC